MNILNVTGEKAELLLHGVVGDEINGVDIANKLQMLKELGVKKITERINSRGGSIVDGYSIVGANLNLTAAGIIVETLNEGVSDSMASVILASGTKGYRKTMDYASAVVHNPLYGNKSLNDIKDEKIKAILTAFKDSLMTIYSAAIGKSIEQISETMNQEKMLNAQQMKEFGIVDEVVKTNINLPDLANMSLVEIYNVYERLNNKSITNTNKNMDKLNEFYNLSKEASEDSLLKAAMAERQRMEDAEAKVSDLEKELDLKTKELEKFQDEANKMAVKAAIDSGKFDKTDENQLLETCKNIGLDAFNLMVSKIKLPHIDVTNLMSKGGKKENKEKKYEDYSERELNELQISNPEKFEALVQEFNEREE